MTGVDYHAAVHIYAARSNVVLNMQHHLQTLLLHSNIKNCLVLPSTTNLKKNSHFFIVLRSPTEADAVRSQQYQGWVVGPIASHNVVALHRSLGIPPPANIKNVPAPRPIIKHFDDASLPPYTARIYAQPTADVRERAYSTGGSEDRISHGHSTPLPPPAFLRSTVTHTSAAAAQGASAGMTWASAYGAGQPSQWQAQPFPTTGVMDSMKGVVMAASSTLPEPRRSTIRDSSTESLGSSSKTPYTGGFSSSNHRDLDPSSSQPILKSIPRKRPIADVEGLDDDEASSDVARASNGKAKRSREVDQFCSYPGLLMTDGDEDTLPTLDHPDTWFSFAIRRIAYNGTSDELQRLIEIQVEKNRLGPLAGEEDEAGDGERVPFLRRTICQILKRFVVNLAANVEEANRPKVVPAVRLDHLTGQDEDEAGEIEKTTKEELTRLRNQLEEERALRVASDARCAAVLEEQATKDALYPGLLEAYETLQMVTTSLLERAPVSQAARKLGTSGSGHV